MNLLVPYLFILGNVFHDIRYTSATPAPSRNANERDELVAWHGEHADQNALKERRLAGCKQEGAQCAGASYHGSSCCGTGLRYVLGLGFKCAFVCILHMVISEALSCVNTGFVFFFFCVCVCVFGWVIGFVYIKIQFT